ncbi:hypothetical protein [Azohydromonas lata]|uniref:hypothetical protein n=1 Tax=Azohydromonas lata TaxID=45677 RepID=UPI00083396E6|nr:hypothetical protein [Azohydromonas lata]
MDSRHTSAAPQAAWRPSLMPQAGAAPRPGLWEPVPLLAALHQDLPMHADATAVGSLQSCLASLAALAFAGLGVALMLHWSSPEVARAAHAAAPVSVSPAVQARALDTPATAASTAFMPAPAAARIERMVPAPAGPVSSPASPQAAPPVSVPLALAPPSRMARTKMAAAPHAAPHAAPASKRDPHATAAARAMPATASTPMPHNRAVQVEAESATAGQADADADLLQAVMDWHEQHAPQPASRR